MTPFFRDFLIATGVVAACALIGLWLAVHV